MTTTLLNGLTRRQQEIYNYLVQRSGYFKHFDETRAYSTVREIGAHFNIKSPNGVKAHLRALKRKGWIDWRPHHQGIVLLKTEKPEA